MNIKLSNAGKRFNREWIFRKANINFISGETYAVVGPNGSGKSTLLQTIGGMLQPSEGKVFFKKESKELNGEAAYQNISFSAPYLDLIEEFTLIEFLEFHKGFKPFILGIDTKNIIEALGLQTATNKQIRNFSSGMKQRVKLAQAVFSATDVVLLDEPCSNLDALGIELYHSLISNYCRNRLVIVSSNDEIEYSFCKHKISIADFKN